MKIGDLVGAYWMNIVTGGRDWMYGIVISPLRKDHTTVRFNCGHIRTFSNWELSQNGLKVLS
jgi:hypothetical protein